jgi:hypothetical protein
MLLPLSPWHKNLTMMSQFWRHFRPTHAYCHASADSLPYRPMHGDWHGLVKMAAKRHLHEQ